MTADLGLVPHAAERHADELTPERPRDGLADRRLAHTGRADEAEDGTAHRVGELVHRQVLQDALLDLLEPVVVAIEDLLRFCQVELLR